MNNHPVYNKFPILSIGEFILRELSLSDTDNFYKYISDPNVNKYLSEDDFPKNLEATKEEISYWSRLFYYKHSIYWAIADKKSNELIGTCGFNNWSVTHKRVEVSYDLNANYWGRGIMTKALGRICKFAMDELSVNRVQATVASDNIPSIRVLEKLGFKQEGLMNHYGILHGVKKNFYMYGLLR